MIQKITLFSSLLQVVKLNNTQLNTQLIKYGTLLKKKTKSERVSNRWGFQSPPLSIENSPLLKKFISTIKTPLEDYVSSYQLADSYEATISGVWFNINSKHHYNTTHVHPGCQFTGSYYIQAAKNCGTVVLEHPLWSKQMDVFYKSKFSIYNQYTSNIYTHECQVGDLLLFPAWLPHHVQTNKSDKDRISISFNINVRATESSSPQINRPLGANYIK